MSLLLAVLVASGLLLWPDHPRRRSLGILPGLGAPTTLTETSRGVVTWLRARRLRQRGGATRVSAQDLLSLLDALAPALDAGLAPASALQIAVDSRSGRGRADPLAELVGSMASAGADGAALGPLWRAAAESSASAELLLLAQAWSLSEEMGAPLAQAVRTTSGLLEARIAHERRLAASVAGARATVNLLTVLPVGGPLVALVLGIGPGELFAGSRLTQGSLALGICLAALGRLWVRRMIRAVAHGPVIA